MPWPALPEEIEEFILQTESPGKPVRSLIWLETYPLTSDSRNQIDLVRSGVHRRLPDGSAPFFVPDVDSDEIRYEFTVHYGHQTYSGNTLKFEPQTAKSWRLQLNGRTSDDQSLTSVARENFQHKVVVFLEVGDLEFEVRDFEKDDVLTDLRSVGTSDQGRKGRAPAGKWFGRVVPVVPASVPPQPARSAPTVEEEIPEAEAEEDFSVDDLEDARRKIARDIVRRQGQPAFRRALLEAYEERCAATGCSVTEVLQAAHIVPYMGEETNRVVNGVLLRADMHVLFDRGLIGIQITDGRHVWRIDGSLRGTQFEELEGKPVEVPAEEWLRPSREAVEWHWVEVCGFDLPAGEGRTAI